MIEIIRSLPRQIKQSIASFPHQAIRKSKTSNVFIAGMGGSGISGDLLRVLHPDIPIINNKDYLVPGFISKKTLTILISYSGNTEEIISNYKHIKKFKSPIVILTSNGDLAKKSCRLKVIIPKGLPPRGAIGFLYTPLPLILYHFGLTRMNPAKELKNLVNFLEQYSPELEKKAEKISRRMFNKLPIIYANSSLFHIVAQRWQCQLNENAKTLAHINVIPEMNHNEIVGFGRPMALNKHTSVILLNDPGAHRRNILRVKILRKIIKGFTSEIIDILPPGKNKLQQAFATIMLGDFVSYFCAIANKIDPLPVKRIDFLKQQLSRY